MNAISEMQRASFDAELLVAQLRSHFGDDEDLALDVIEGQTDALECVDAMLAWRSERLAVAAGLKVYAETITRRAKRMEASDNAVRDVLTSFMERTGLRKIVRPLANLSLGNKAKSVIGSGVEGLSENLIRTTHDPNKTAIKEALEAGDYVPGYSLSNGGVTLVMRTS